MPLARQRQGRIGGASGPASGLTDPGPDYVKSSRLDIIWPRACAKNTTKIRARHFSFQQTNEAQKMSRQDMLKALDAESKGEQLLLFLVIVSALTGIFSAYL